MPFLHDALHECGEIRIRQKIARQKERALHPVLAQCVQNRLATFRKLMAGENQGNPPGRSRPSYDPAFANFLAKRLGAER
jgi:hypothetical protein